jgi:hypothetical protein
MASSAAPSATSSATAAVSSAAPGVKYSDFAFTLLLTCATASCHTPNYFKPDMSDSNGDLYTVLTTTMVARCGGAPLVKPGDAANSAIVKVVKHECGTFVMPPGCTDAVCISDTDLESITSWINAGALR